MITLIICVFWCYLHCFQYLIYTIQNNFLLFSSSMCINSSIGHSSIKCFKAVAFLDKTLYDDYLSLVASNQQQNWEMAKRRKSRKRRKSLEKTVKVKANPNFVGKLGNWSTPKRVWISAKHSAPSLSCDRRIKMHQSINALKLRNKSATISNFSSLQLAMLLTGTCKVERILNSCFRNGIPRQA